MWRRTLPKAVGYHKYQRCGVAVPNVHPACHLDDARRRDTGEHVDATGGWHDAGDLRKWMGATLMNGIGLLRVARHLGFLPGREIGVELLERDRGLRLESIDLVADRDRAAALGHGA